MADEIEIQVDDSPQAEVAVADKPAAEVVPAQKPAGDPATAVEDLRRQIEAEKAETARLAREKAETERRLADVSQRTEVLQRETQDSHLHVINTAIDAASKESLAIRRELADAHSAGDYDKVAEIQERQADNRFKLQQLRLGKEDLEARQRRAPPQTHEGRAVPPPAPPSREEQFNAYVGRFTQPTADYMRKHPELVTDPRMQRLAEAAHVEAVDGNGIAVDTPEYFAFIDKKFGWQAKAAAKDPAPTPAPPARRQAAAPVSREAPASTAPTSGATVRLSAEEQDIAKSMGMTNQEYAANKLALIRQGKLAS